jgi:hypothetical protein
MNRLHSFGLADLLSASVIRESLSVAEGPRFRLRGGRRRTGNLYLVNRDTNSREATRRRRQAEKILSRKAG